MLSAVERVKSEVEQPPPSNTGQQQQQVTRPTGSWLQCFAATISSVAGLALAPLTAWQAQKQQPPLQRRKSLPQRLLSLGSAGHAEEQVQQQRPGSGAGSGGGSSSIATGSTDGAVDSAQDLVGVDGNGQPFAGLCNPVSRCFRGNWLLIAGVCGVVAVMVIERIKISGGRDSVAGSGDGSSSGQCKAGAGGLGWDRPAADRIL
jgi:hypothetical protein